MILPGYQRLIIFMFELPWRERLRLAQRIRRYERLSPEEREEFPTQYRRFSPQLFVWVMLRMSVDKPLQAGLGVIASALLYVYVALFLIYKLIRWIF